MAFFTWKDSSLRFLLRWTCSVETMRRRDLGREGKGARGLRREGKEVCMYHESKGHVVRSRTKGVVRALNGKGAR